MNRSVALQLVVLAFGVSCNRTDTTTPPAANGLEKKALLASVGEHVILATYRTFVERARELEMASAALRVSVDAGASDTASLREAAQAAWRSAMSVWQEAELYQVGPAGSSLSRVMGARDLRDEIYSWPTVNSCRIDQEIVAKQYESPTFFETALVNVKGLDALEYLLFYEDARNTCPPQVAINQGPWQALDAVELAKRRAAYAQAASAQLMRSAVTLRDAWEPSQGDFLGQLTRAGETGSIYGSAQEALDELFAAMFYLDIETKDMKLARPAGISPECRQATCPEALESPWSNHAKENVAANLRAIEKLLHGGAPADSASRTGFNDLLTALGAGDLATEMTADIALAQMRVEAIPVSMRSALEGDVASVEAAHAAVKALTDDLKSRFVTVLNLRVPDEGAADND